METGNLSMKETLMKDIIFILTVAEITLAAYEVSDITTEFIIHHPGW